MRAWAIVLMGVLTGQAALAQEPAGDATVGHQLARTWCSGCHLIDSTGGATGGQARDAAPSFPAVARQSSTTALALHAFLQTPHQRMPDWQLTRGQIDDLIAYILSLKGG